MSRWSWELICFFNEMRTFRCEYLLHTMKIQVHSCIFWIIWLLLIHAMWIECLCVCVGMPVCVCVCEKSFMSTVQPQHPDEVSLIGSLWDSSAAFSQWIPARRQQVGSAGAAVSKRAKDGGGRCFLFSSTLRFPFAPHTYKCGQALTGKEKKQKNNEKQNRATVGFHCGVPERLRWVRHTWHDVKTLCLPSQNNCRFPASCFLLIVLQLPLCFLFPNGRLLKRADGELRGFLSLLIRAG